MNTSNTAAHPTAAAIALLRAAFPGRFDEDSIRLYSRMLADVPPRRLVPTIDRLIKSHPGEWLPTVATIRRAVASEWLALPSPAEAWAWASDVARPLRDRAPEPLLEAVEAAGGRWNIRTTDVPTIVRGQFTKDYLAACERAVADAAANTGCQPPLKEAPTLAALPLTASFRLRPLLARQLSLADGYYPPTDLEKHDAIMALRDHPDDEELQALAQAMLDTAT
jgi:hypothetical protein